MIALSAVVAGYEAIDRLIHPPPIQHLGWVAAAGLVGFVGNELVALYRIRVGRRIGSAALVADGLHARTDGFTSLAVLLGAGGVALGFPLADPIVGLADHRGDPGGAAHRRPRRVPPADGRRGPGRWSTPPRPPCRATPGVVAVRSVRMRWIGHRLHADAELDVDPSTSLPDAHRIAHDAEHELTHAVPKLDHRPDPRLPGTARPLPAGAAPWDSNRTPW